MTGSYLSSISALLMVVGVTAPLWAGIQRAAEAHGSAQTVPQAPEIQSPDTQRLGPDSRAISVVSSQIDPIAPPSDTKKGLLTIQNAAAAATTVLLSFDQPRRGAEAVAGTFQFVAGNGLTTMRQYYAPIAAGSAAFVPFEVSGVKTSGTITAAVMNRGTRIGEVSVQRYPFALTVENAETPLAVTGDLPTVVTLTNGDSNSYKVRLDLTVGGQPLCDRPLGSAPVRSCLKQRFPWVDPPPACHPRTVIVPASQKTTFDFFPNCRISSGTFTGLLRDETRSARLSVTHIEPNRGINGAAQLAGAEQPDLTIPLSATVGYGHLSDFWRQIWSTALIGIVLALGGVASVLARYWVPNQISRHRLIERAERLDLQASNLSEHVGSDLRLAVRVNAKQLADLLRSLPAISADTSVTLAQYEKVFEFVETRIVRLEQLEAAWQRLRQLLPDGPAPSAVRGIERQLRKAAQLLAAPDGGPVQREQVRSLIDEATTAMDGLSTVDDAFRTAASERLQELRASFKTECGLKEGQKLTWLRHLLPGPFCLLDSDQAVDAWFDANLATLEVIRDYLRIYNRSTDAAFIAALDQREPELVQHLSSSTLPGLRQARGLVKQMHEGIFESDVLDAIRQGQFAIQCDPRSFSSYQLVRLAVRFNRAPLNEAAARERFTCRWQFPPTEGTKSPAEAQMTELGWDIRHYFVGGRSAIDHRVRVTFLGPKGEEIRQDGVSDQKGEIVTKDELLRTLQGGLKKPSGRMRAEWVGLSVVLFIALLGLITGAREQITKLDLVPGLIAVFLLGFGADAIKTLLTRQPAPGSTT